MRKNMAKLNIESTAYYGPEGLSSTAAEHLSHIASDLAEAARHRLSTLSFVSESVRLLDGASEPVEVKRAVTGDEYEAMLEGDLSLIAEASGFIAWVREAVKAKERLIQKIRDTTLEEWHLAAKGEPYPGADELRKAGDELAAATRDEQSYFAEMGVRELCRYLRLDSEAAAIGRLIHKDGSLRKALEEALAAERNPVAVTGAGHESVVRESTLTRSSAQIQEDLVKMQMRHREVEAQVNKVKYGIRQRMEENNRRARAAAADRRKAAMERQQLLALEYQNWISEQAEAAADLRIVVPDDLKGFVAGLQKK